jgi:hypothetical protein
MIGECLSGNGICTFSILPRLGGLGGARGRTYCFLCDSEERSAGFLKLIFCDRIWLFHVRIQLLSPQEPGRVSSEQRHSRERRQSFLFHLRQVLVSDSVSTPLTRYSRWRLAVAACLRVDNLIVRRSKA